MRHFHIFLRILNSLEITCSHWFHWFTIPNFRAINFDKVILSILSPIEKVQVDVICHFFHFYIDLVFLKHTVWACFLINIKKTGNESSGKQSDPGHFSKSQGKFFFSFLCTLFKIFLRPKKLQIEILKSFLSLSVFHYCHFFIFTLFEYFFLVKKK